MNDNIDDSGNDSDSLLPYAKKRDATAFSESETGNDSDDSKKTPATKKSRPGPNLSAGGKSSKSPTVRTPATTPRRYSPDERSIPTPFVETPCGTQTVTQKWYEEEKNNDIPALILLCFGLLSDKGIPLVGKEQEPFSGLPVKGWLAGLPMFREEVDRRARLFEMTATVKPNNWSKTKCMKWLEDNPIKQQMTEL